MASFANRPLGSAPTGNAPTPLDIPWIDIHQHTQSLTWNDREKFDLSSARAAVMIAAGYYWAPYRPVSADDVRFLWDDALRRAACFDHRHFYDQYVAVGVHTWAGVDGAAELLAALPKYCEDDRVVAIGETGIESTHHTAAWSLDDQRDVVREQMHIARETGLPILVHTPGSSKGGLPAQYSHSYEEANESFTEPLLDPKNAKREAVEIDLELAAAAGLPDEQVVIDHASPEIVPLVMETTDCYLSFSISAPWLRGFDPADVASAIEEYGADKIVLDTDLIGAMEHDAFAMKRTIMDLARLDVDRESIRKVVYENPKAILGIE